MKFKSRNISYVCSKEHIFWIKGDLRHRLKGPAVISSFSGRHEWFKDGAYFRLNGPAIVEGKNTMLWFKNGLWVSCFFK
jgi:hypothetical protein